MLRCDDQFMKGRGQVDGDKRGRDVGNEVATAAVVCMAFLTNQLRFIWWRTSRGQVVNTLLTNYIKIPYSAISHTNNLHYIDTT